MDDAQVGMFRDMSGLVHGFGRRGRRGETKEEGRERLAEALRPRGRLFLLRQVHGTALEVPPWDAPPEADASSAGEAGILLGIETADCLPVLFVDSHRKRVAAAHAGWRGTAAGIVGRVMTWLEERGSGPATLRVALGPCIGACCYQVGDELRASFADADQRFFVPGPRGRSHLDVRGINERQLLARGVAAGNIAHVRDCTHCAPALYHSYRRDGAGTGRMISYVGWGL